MIRYGLHVLRWSIVLFCLFGVVTVSVAANKTPSVEVMMDRSTINSGETVSVTWKTKFAKYCFISHGVGLVKRKGTIELTPVETTTYKITAYSTKWRSNMSAEDKKANEIDSTFTITVEGVKPSVSFAASTTSIYEGDAITLSWDTRHTSVVSINQGIGTVGTKGDIKVIPAKTTEYQLTAKGPGGVVIQKVKVKVNKRAQ